MYNNADTKQQQRLCGERLRKMSRLCQPVCGENPLLLWATSTTSTTSCSRAHYSCGPLVPLLLPVVVSGATSSTYQSPLLAAAEMRPEDKILGDSSVSIFPSRCLSLLCLYHSFQVSVSALSLSFPVCLPHHSAQWHNIPRFRTC